jgi:hypothetical protein
MTVQGTHVDGTLLRTSGASLKKTDLPFTGAGGSEAALYEPPGMRRSEGPESTEETTRRVKKFAGG